MEIKSTHIEAYSVGVINLNLKREVDGIDSDGANWYNICDLSRENLRPFAIYSVEKNGI